MTLSTSTKVTTTASLSPIAKDSLELRKLPSSCQNIPNTCAKIQNSSYSVSINFSISNISSVVIESTKKASDSTNCCNDCSEDSSCTYWDYDCLNQICTFYQPLNHKNTTI